MTGGSSSVGGWGTASHAGASSGSGGLAIGTPAITIVSARAASLCWWAALKSSRRCMSMNARRLG